MVFMCVGGALHWVSTTWAERDQCAQTSSPQCQLVVAVALRVGLADLQPRAAGQLQVVDREAAEVRHLLDGADARC
jgi:hypothetical protein